MTLSVVIPSYARADLLAPCLRSVTRFAPPGTEILVVDDGSAGGVISRTATSFPGVRAVRLPKRAGFCAAANAGLAAATGDVVELLNDDTEVTEGWAAAALRWFADPGVASVAPLVLQLDPGRRARGLPPLIDSAGDEYDPGGFARKRGHATEARGGEGEKRRRGEVNQPVLTPPLLFSPSPPLSEAGPVWGASAAAAFYRRSAVLAAGGFPAHFGAYFEDVDLACRLRRAGFAARYDPASVVWHRVSSSYGRRPGRRTLEQQSCNEERLFWRNSRWRHLPRHAAVLAGKAARRLEEGALGPWLAGRCRAWGGG